MGRKVILSADSTCDMDESLQARYDVSFYPFHIILEDVDYRDNVDIDADAIFSLYRERGSLPRTSAINEGEYVAYFKPFVDAGYEVVHLNLGSALSSAHANACLAAEKLDGVYPVDSCNLSTGIALLVMRARELIDSGLSGAEVASALEDLRGCVHSSFILDTLDFLAAGGRCSSVTALLASAIKMKPAIEVNNTDGSMSVGKKYRGTLSKVHGRYVADKLAQYDDIVTDHLFITHSGIEPEYIESVREAVASIADFEEIHTTRASCTISSHCGPNTLGILFMTESPSA